MSKKKKKRRNPDRFKRLDGIIYTAYVKHHQICVFLICLTQKKNMKLTTQKECPSNVRSSFYIHVRERCEDSPADSSYSLSSAGENLKWRFLSGTPSESALLLLLPWSKFRLGSPLVVYCAHLSLSASSGMFGLLMRNAVWEMKRRAVGVRLCMHLHWDKPCMVDVGFLMCRMQSFWVWVRTRLQSTHQEGVYTATPAFMTVIDICKYLHDLKSPDGRIHLQLFHQNCYRSDYKEIDLWFRKPNRRFNFDHNRYVQIPNPKLF